MLKHFRPAVLFLALPLMVLVAIAPALAQTTPPRLTTEWIFSDAGERLAEVPQFTWLADNSAILYDVRQPETQRTYERLDPATGERRPVVDMHKAVASLTSVDSSSEVRQALPWPEAFDATGRQAVFLFHGDIFLLDLASSTFLRVTNTPAEEKDVEFSPDGHFLAFVRSS